MNSDMNSAMIKDYIAQALSHARYEVIEDEEPYYGEVPGLAGVYATGRSLEECRENLKNVIEGWILARREHNLAVESIFRKAGLAEGKVKPGTIAEVIVLEPSDMKKKRSLTSIIVKGQGCYSSAEEVDAFIRKERESWETSKK